MNNSISRAGRCYSIRPTSLIKPAISTADIRPENVKPESPAAVINSSSYFSAR